RAYPVRAWISVAAPATRTILSRSSRWPLAMTSSSSTLVVPGRTRPQRRLIRSNPSPSPRRPLRAAMSSTASRMMTFRPGFFFFSGSSGRADLPLRRSTFEAPEERPPAPSPRRATSGRPDRGGWNQDYGHGHRHEPIVASERGKEGIGFHARNTRPEAEQAHIALLTNIFV